MGFYPKERGIWRRRVTQDGVGGMITIDNSGMGKYLPPGPRCPALPVADTAGQKRVPRSAGRKPALPGEAAAGHRKRERWPSKARSDEERRRKVSLLGMPLISVQPAFLTRPLRGAPSPRERALGGCELERYWMEEKL